MKAKVKLFPPCILYVYTMQTITYNFIISLFKLITVTVLTPLNNAFPVQQYESIGANVH